MKIRIEPTEPQGDDIEGQNPGVEVWLAGDDHNLQEVIDHLVVPALRAFGYIISEGRITVEERDQA